MIKKNKRLDEMKLWSCEGWSQKKCKSYQPCQMIVPVGCNKIRGCPENKKGKWTRVPTTRLTL